LRKRFQRARLYGAIEAHFEVLLLCFLVGATIGVAIVDDLLVKHGVRRYDPSIRLWLREQAALLIGGLFGLLRGQHKKANGDKP
jgi:hypothetical protein